MAKNITVIPATIDRFTDLPLTNVKKRKVAAYARVSTDELSQQYHAPFCLILVYHKSVENASGIGRLSLTR